MSACRTTSPFSLLRAYLIGLLRCSAARLSVCRVVLRIPRCLSGFNLTKGICTWSSCWSRTRLGHGDKGRRLEQLSYQTSPPQLMPSTWVPITPGVSMVPVTDFLLGGNALDTSTTSPKQDHTQQSKTGNLHLWASGIITAPAGLQCRGREGWGTMCQHHFFHDIGVVAGGPRIPFWLEPIRPPPNTSPHFRHLFLFPPGNQHVLPTIRRCRWGRTHRPYS